MIYEKENRYIIPFDDVPAPRAQMPEIPVDERRGNFKEAETGFPEEVAVAEAKRCLSCRRCLGCALCWAECEPEAINFDIPDEELDLDKPQNDSAIDEKGYDNSFGINLRYVLDPNLYRYREANLYAKRLDGYTKYERISPNSEEQTDRRGDAWAVLEGGCRPVPGCECGCGLFAV